jgi:multiple sugar transport system permease protein
MRAAASSRPGRRAWLLAAPVVLYLAFFLVYPAAQAIQLALTDTISGRFPSLANLDTIAHDALFHRALIDNLVLPIATVALEIVSGLALALLFAAHFPGRRVLRTIAVVPFALPEIVFLTVMRSVLAPHGYANDLLLRLGLGPVEWLLPGRGLTFVVVVVVDAWHVTPVAFLLLLAALSSIPEEVNEAARLDGARRLARLRFITLPLLGPAIAATLLLRGVDAMRVFATPLMLTGVEGVPVLSTYAYHQWSDYGDDASAAAAAMLLAILNVGLALPLLARRWGAIAGSSGVVV